MTLALSVSPQENRIWEYRVEQLEMAVVVIIE
jgi:hypothetical protein